MNTNENTDNIGPGPAAVLQLPDLFRRPCVDIPQEVQVRKS